MLQVNSFKIVSVLALQLLLGASSQARIGETFEQCEKRYGRLIRIEQSFRPDFPQYCFQLGEVKIRVRFLDNKSAEEIFAGADKRLTAGQIEEIIHNNQPISGTNDYDAASGVLRISTADFDRVFKDAGKGF